MKRVVPSQLSILLAVVIAVAVYGYCSLPGPEKTPLYATPLEPSQLAEVTHILEQLDISHELRPKVGAILVPDHRKGEIQMILAARGLPRSKGPRDAYLRTVTFENTIREAVERDPSILEASVHVTLPRDTYFPQDREPATALVQVTLSPGTSLTPEKVRHIQNMASYVVPELQVAKVGVFGPESHPVQSNIPTD